MSHVNFTERSFKRRAKAWLAEGRTHEEIADKMYEICDHVIDAAREQQKKKLDEFFERQLEEILKPVELKSMGPSKRELFLFGGLILFAIVLMVADVLR